MPIGGVFAASSDVVTLDKKDLEKPQYLEYENPAALKGTLLIKYFA